MLVLSKYVDEEIIIGDDIIITVIDIRGGGRDTRVRIGIVAPSDVMVDRMEVRLRRERDERRKGD